MNNVTYHLLVSAVREVLYERQKTGASSFCVFISINDSSERNREVG